MRKIVALCLCLCLLAGCVGKSMERRPVESRQPEITATPEPTSSPTPPPEPTEVPTPTPTPEPTLPETALALLALSDTDYVMDKAAGDLNGDGLVDWAVVIEHPEDEKYIDGGPLIPRTIIILLGDKNADFILGPSNSHFVYRRDGDDRRGVPYEGVSIEKGEFHYGDFGGNPWKYRTDYTFSWQLNDLTLTRVERVVEISGRGEEISYDLREGEYQQRILWEENAAFNGKLLWEQKISPMSPCFEELPDRWGILLDQIALPPLPNLGYYDFGDPEHRNQTEISPEEVLDTIRAEHFPDMEPVELLWTEETRETYSAAIGCQVPGHYYANDKGTLSYFADYSALYRPASGDKMEEQFYSLLH